VWEIRTIKERREDNIAESKQREKKDIKVICKCSIC
jgi:hypothetical protein